MIISKTNSFKPKRNEKRSSIELLNDAECDATGGK